MGTVIGKKGFGDRITDIVVCIVFGLFTLLCIFPFYYIFINTISDNDLVAQGKITFFPIGFHLTNYLEVIQLRGLGQASLVSVARTIIGPVTNLLCCTFLGFLFMHKEMFLRKYAYRFLIITMYLNAGLIPTFINYKNLGLLDTFWVYIVPGLVSAYNVILIKTFMESIPPSLEESAQLDGAGIIRTYWNIIMPVSVPIIATLAIFGAVGHWSAYMDTMLYVVDSDYFTLQFLLYNYLNEVNVIAEAMRNNASQLNVDPARMLTPTAVRMTVSMIVVLPILFVYPIGQRFFLKGIMLGAVKG